MVGSFLVDTVNEVASSLYHTLVDEYLEWLVGTRVTTVVEELIPESGIDQVTRSMLSTTDI